MVPENHEDDPRDLDGVSDPLAHDDSLDLDEDLFDFPEPDVTGPNATQPDSVIDVDATLPPAPVPAPQSSSQPVSMEETIEQPMPQPRSADGHDFTPGDPLEATSHDLDEDIFDFGEVFDSVTVPTAPVATSTPEPVASEPNYDEAPAAQASVEPLSSIVEDTLEEGEDLIDLDLESAAPTITPIATSDADMQTEGASQPHHGAQAFDPRIAPVERMANASKSRGHTVEVLAICFLLVNVSMVFFAWRAGDEFRQTLAHVSGTVNEVLTNNTNTTSSTPILPAPIIEVTPGPFEIESVEDEVSLPEMSRTALELARRRIEDQEFEDARRGLQRLLANQDRAALEPQQLAEAELLIARSYYLEGLEIREDV
jgi:hypothetical protein